MNNNIIDEKYLKTSEDYLQAADIAVIDDAVQQVTNKLINKGINIPKYTRKTWNVLRIPYYEDFEVIQNGIFNLQHYYYAPEGWDYGQLYQNFSYKDINRWINNVNLMNNAPDVKMTIWNYQYFTNWESTDGDLEWED